jgi:hypothetical protein
MASQGDRLAAFVREVARLNYDGEELAGELFEMENDDAVSTLGQLILEARSLTEAEIPEATPSASPHAPQPPEAGTGVMCRRFEPPPGAGRHRQLTVALPSGWQLVEVAYAIPSLRLSEGATGAWFFAVHPELAPHLALEQILAAVASWVDAAPTGQPRYPLNEGHALNLGDAIDGMAPDDWARFGVLWVASPTTRATFEVDHDDPLAFPD